MLFSMALDYLHLTNCVELLYLLYMFKKKIHVGKRLDLFEFALSLNQFLYVGSQLLKL